MATFTPATVADTLLATPAVLRARLASVPVELHSWKQDPTSWSINEVIGHLIAVDRVAFADRIEQMVAQHHPTLPAVDVQQLAHERQDQHYPLDQLLIELAEQREHYATLVRSLTAGQLARTGYYQRYGDFRVSDFVYEWAYHDHAHLQQIFEILKQAIWPQFSPTMQRALGGYIAVEMKTGVFDR